MIMLSSSDVLPPSGAKCRPSPTEPQFSDGSVAADVIMGRPLTRMCPPIAPDRTDAWWSGGHPPVPPWTEPWFLPRETTHGMCSAYFILSFCKSMSISGIITEYVLLLLGSHSFYLQSKVLLQNWPHEPQHYITISGTYLLLWKRITNHIIKAKVPLFSFRLFDLFHDWWESRPHSSWIDFFDFAQVSLYKYGCILVRRMHLYMVQRVRFVQLGFLNKCLSKLWSCLITSWLAPSSKSHCTLKPESEL